MHELSALLWRERELLDLLVFKLEEEQLLLTAGRTRWLPRASAEIAQITDELRALTLARAVEVSDILGKDTANDEPSLREIIAAAPADGPWAEILTAHLNALGALAEQIRMLRQANEQFLRAAVRSTQETIAGIHSEPTTYDATGSAANRTATARLLDTDI